MAVWVGRLTVVGICRRGSGWVVGAATHVKAVLYKCDAEPGSGAILGRVGGVKKVCEKETDELE